MSFCPSVLGTQWPVTIAHSLGYIERKNKRKKEPPIDKLNIESWISTTPLEVDPAQVGLICQSRELLVQVRPDSS